MITDVTQDEVNRAELAMDAFRAWAQAKELTNIGVCGAPFEMEKILDFTGLRGSGSQIYYSLIYKLPKWAYSVKKVDEWLEVTPTYAEYYNITIAQKQKLEGAIKAGLTSATQAVADYELLKHDSRRYKEVIDYFKEGQKDEHVIRSLFVDRVDAYTGEGYSLVTMARRWPTIITDFIRMKTEWTDPKIPEKEHLDKIRKELDVTQAEATVLKTKNQLYREWKEIFFPVVKERYARIEALVTARKKSVDEYKSWLKPYIARYKMIREKAEEKPAEYLSNAYMTPGFGQSQAWTGVRLWVWKPFTPAEMGKPEAVIEKRTGDFMVDPYDDLIKEWKEKIEKKYNVEITDEEVRQILKNATTRVAGKEVNEMDKSSLYYIMFDMKVILNLVKTPPPEGLETDNLMFMPLKTWVISQNVLLMHLIELYAREKSFEKYVNEMIGAKEIEEAITKHIEEEFAEKKPERLKSWKSFSRKTGSVGRKLHSGADAFVHIFVKRGPYETNFEERITKMFFRAIGPLYSQVVEFIEERMGT